MSEPSSHRGVPRFTLESAGPSLRGATRAWAAVADGGKRAAVLGDESGRLDVWVWPFRLASNVQLGFRLPGQTVVIEGADIARQTVVRPEGTSIVYVHPRFTVRQHTLVPLQEPGVLMLLEVESTQALDIVVRMHADLNTGWPGLGTGSMVWQADRRRFLLTQGIVRTQQSVIGSPFAVRGVVQTAHDAPTSSEFVLSFDPAVALADYIPIVFAGGSTVRDSVDQVYRRLLERAADYWRAKSEHYRRVQQDQLNIATGERVYEQAFAWSKISLDQQLRGLAALNAPALVMVGQHDRVREELRMLAKQQTQDGRIPHDAAAARTRITDPPHAWVGDDAAPFWILACHSYWTASGDDALIRELWPNVVKALRRFTVLGRDADIYTTGLWVAALEGLPAMAQAAGDASTGASAVTLFERSVRSLEDRFWLAAAGIYAFGARLPDEPAETPAASISESLTPWPAAPLAFGLLEDERANRMLREINSAALTTDWGTRTLSRYDSAYDPLRAERGAVWSYSTGWTAQAHYRYHRGWAGAALVRDLATATFDFARGRTPDLLSGASYTTIDSMAVRQVPAVPMLIPAIVSGMLGLQVDAPNRALLLEPHLPADWDALTVNQIRIGRERVRMEVRRERGRYFIDLRREGTGATLFVRLSPALPLGARVERVRVNDSDAPIQVEESAHDVHVVIEVALIGEANVEIEYQGGLEVHAPAALNEAGDRPGALKVLDFRREGTDFVLLVEGVPASSYSLRLRTESRLRAVSGADISEHSGDRLDLRVRFGPGLTPFARREVRIRT